MQGEAEKGRGGVGMAQQEQLPQGSGVTGCVCWVLHRESVLQASLAPVWESLCPQSPAPTFFLVPWGPLQGWE